MARLLRFALAINVRESAARLPKSCVIPIWKLSGKDFGSLAARYGADYRRKRCDGARATGVSNLQKEKSFMSAPWAFDEEKDVLTVLAAEVSA
jgi:hypothetical protein